MFTRGNVILEDFLINFFPLARTEERTIIMSSCCRSIDTYVNSWWINIIVSQLECHFECSLPRFCFDARAYTMFVTQYSLFSLRRIRYEYSTVCLNTYRIHVLRFDCQACRKPRQMIYCWTTSVCIQREAGQLVDQASSTVSSSPAMYSLLSAVVFFSLYQY